MTETMVKERAVNRSEVAAVKSAVTRVCHLLQTAETQAQPGQWTKGICPNCRYPQAEVDPEGIVWCPACGYSKKGGYT